MDTKLTKADIEALMLPEMDAIVQYWNTHGQIFEGQFQFASSHIIKYYSHVAFEIMLEHGAVLWADPEDEENDELPPIFVHGQMIPNEGCMYTFYSPGGVKFSDAEKNILAYYQEHSSI